jgi:hypothetical protein
MEGCQLLESERAHLNPPEGLKALRQLALDRDTTVQALMIEATNDLLRKYKRRPVAQTAR